MNNEPEPEFNDSVQTEDIERLQGIQLELFEPGWLDRLKRIIKRNEGEN